MALELKRAQRSKAYLRLGLAAPSGGGKTAGALIIAYGLMKEKYPNLPDDKLWDKIAIVDTEAGSGQMYVGSEFQGMKVGVYNAVTLTAPFEVSKYIQAMELCEEAGMEVCILDSTTHAWSGEGGLLEQQGNAAKRSGNSYTAWRDITPQHNKFVEKMLQTPMHIIATMRSKQEYVQEKNNETGKAGVKKLGLEPEQRKGMEYEFTTFFEIDSEHNAFGSKDRTSMFDQKTFIITPKVGREMMKWLDGGVDTEPVVVATVKKANPTEGIETMQKNIIETLKGLGGSSNEEAVATVKKYTPNGNPNSIKDATKLAELQSELDLLQATKQ